MSRITEKNTLIKETGFNVILDHSRDELLTDFGRGVLKDRYLLEGERIQDLFARVASYYADDSGHAQRLYDYISKMWFMPSTPILSNGGTNRGLPISCFLNEVQDDMRGIVDIWTENVWLASHGGGIGSYWGNVRSIGEKVKGNGQTSGIVPFIGVQDRLTLAVSQGNLRRGSSAVYLPIWHPEIEEFIEIRRPTGGDPNRKSLNLHHGVVITDEFMEAVENDRPWELKSPKDGTVMHITKARDLWIRMLLARVETGEPYMLFIDSVNRLAPEIYKKLGVQIKTSNLCSEITLATGKDHLGKERTAVCCLSSLNIETYDNWSNDPQFIHDVMAFLDNVLQDFIDHAGPEHARAVYAAMRERSVGLGTMGFHSLMQSKNVPLESVVALSWNKKIFAHIKEQVDLASKRLADVKGACPDGIDCGIHERFTNKIAIAPTASISIIAGNSSPGIEPYAANVFTQKTLSGSFNVRNKHLRILLQQKGADNDEVWASIMHHEGSVSHLNVLTKHEKDVFKTAFEIDQKWLIQMAADRTEYICQAQSLNIFLPADIHKRDLHQIHFIAWKNGIKSLYYLRSKSLQRAERVSFDTSSSAEQLKISLVPILSRDIGEPEAVLNKYDECLACQ